MTDQVVEGFWATADDDDLMHACRKFNQRTLCGKMSNKHIVRSMPDPKVVDCEGCLAAGARNAEKPESGYWNSPIHNAWVPPSSA